MVYAIIETGGKQLRVEPGRFYDVDRLSAEIDQQLTLDRVLFVSHDEGVSIGQPLVEGATVAASVMSQLRGRKIIVYKMRPKKKTRKKQGHRQELTRLMIDSISLNGRTFGVEDMQPVDSSDTVEENMQPVDSSDAVEGMQPVENSAAEVDEQTED
ncbi:MAG: 50S ribosomal protein L21 [Leptolyngbyaceae cyanobacterium SM1_1_3]|nr:50S ribosomal protein L21 [Leptolyngbyaceae cyanobacterium SM1_1_3]NJN04315.1 50S ribosomal protein L21 [Leptolyngbyaceae cyanobacterium RM1_1_2]NJO10421.1 50S ribosomal protein L21 [Leptolyngbyaceae cyanobacterium SL_1_1]